MFKINIYVRFAIMAICALLTVYFAMDGSWVSAIITFVIFSFFVAGYILLGTVAGAAQYIQAGDFEKAENYLKLTLKPEWLYSANRGFYYMLQGTLASQKRDTAATKAAFNKALEVGLPSDNETAMAYLQLANIAATKNNWQHAQAQVRKLKGLKITEPQLKEQVRQFEKAIQQRGQMKHMQHRSRRKR